MFRFSTMTAALVGAMLALAPLDVATAATSKSSGKKSSTTAKKKSTSGTKSKKKTPAKSGTTGNKTAAGESLDLPLPAKVGGAEEAGSSTGSTGKKKSSTTADTTEDSKAKTGEGAEKKATTPEKKSGAPSGKSGSASEKAGTTSEKTGAATEKPAEKPTSETTASDKPAAKDVPDPAVKRERAPNATVEPESIAEFSAQPAKIQQMIRDAIDLTRQNLTYSFGSADPAKGGMDCSGTIYHLLRLHGFNDVARDSSGQYLWARKTGTFFPVVSKSAESVEFSDLKPGDLMFWTGTYESGRDVPISHVMLYLGREKGSGKRIMFGASDGRSYNGVQRWGVSVFDFKMPKSDPANAEKTKVDFVGYARIPGLRDGVTAAVENVVAKATGDEAPEAPVKATTPRPKKQATGDETPEAPVKAATPRPKRKSSTTRKSQ